MEQRTAEWHAARLGIPTASRYGEILTGTGKQSQSAQGYMNELLADRLAGFPVDRLDPTYWMDRGTEMEDRARVAYTFVTGLEVEQVGFVRHGELPTGGSPDGLIGEDGIIEIKCPKAKTVIAYLRGGKLPTTYIPQVQGYLWLTGRKWADFMAYHPALPPFIVRAQADGEYHAKLEEALRKFCEKMEKQYEQLTGGTDER